MATVPHVGARIQALNESRVAPSQGDVPPFYG